MKKTYLKERIADMIEEERNRARNPLAAEIKHSRNHKLKIVSDALRIPTEEEFLKAMREYGLTDEELKSALEAWREGPS